MLNIVLLEPEIPQNTGNIARTCSVTGTKLHIIKPIAFSLEDKYLKRAGLDYWNEIDVEVHESFEEYLDKYGDKETYYATTKGPNVYSDVNYDLKDKDIYIMFGKETKGIPEEFLKEKLDKTIRIPMKKNLRSLNLANSVNIILYEILRQNDFYGLEETSTHLDN